MHDPKNKHGFTLVEVAIVLIILGLIVGGVLVGQTLIRAAALRNIVTEYEYYHAVISTFRQKYDALPGDMTNATRYWPRADTGVADGNQCANAWMTTETGTHTCNGDGDGKIFVDNPESFRFFQHLSNAGLIEGSFSGVHGPNSVSHAIIGHNVPPSKAGDGTGWSFDEMGYPANPHYWNRTDEGNTLVIGTENGTYSTEDAAFPVEEIWSIDNKIDDGLPGVGVVQAMPRDFPTFDRNSPATQTYPLGATGRGSISFVGIF